MDELTRLKYQVEEWRTNFIALTILSVIIIVLSMNVSMILGYKHGYNARVEETTESTVAVNVDEVTR